jgi:aspartate carbamoyltransferase catalytic subunit
VWSFHFLTIEGLSKENLTKILDTAQSFLDDNNNLINRPTWTCNINVQYIGRQTFCCCFKSSTGTCGVFKEEIHNRQVQLNQDGNLKHFLTIEGLSKENLTKILDTAQSFVHWQTNVLLLLQK